MGDEPRKKEVVVPIAPPLLVGEIVQWLGEGEERITSSTFPDRLHQRELLPISELFWWRTCDEHSGYCTPTTGSTVEAAAAHRGREREGRWSDGGGGGERTEERKGERISC